MVSAKADESFAAVAERLHIESLASTIILSMEVEKSRFEKLRVACSESSFVQTCLVWAHREKAAVLQRGTGSVITDDFWRSFENDVIMAAKKTYTEQVRKAALDDITTTEKADKLKKKEEDALAAASLLPKEAIVQQGLREILKKKFKGKAAKQISDAALVEFSKLVEIDVKAISNDVLKSTDNPPKNGVTPAAGRGQNSASAAASGSGNNNGGKGKSGPKSSPRKEQTKGKGKGKEQEKGKGKGKEQAKGNGKGGEKKPPKGPKNGGKQSGKGGKSKAK